MSRKKRTYTHARYTCYHGAHARQRFAVNPRVSGPRSWRFCFRPSSLQPVWRWHGTFFPQHALTHTHERTVVTVAMHYTLGFRPHGTMPPLACDKTSRDWQDECMASAGFGFLLAWMAGRRRVRVRCVDGYSTSCTYRALNLGMPPGTVSACKGPPRSYPSFSRLPGWLPQAFLPTPGIKACQPQSDPSFLARWTNEPTSLFFFPFFSFGPGCWLITSRQRPPIPIGAKSLARIC